MGARGIAPTSTRQRNGECQRLGNERAGAADPSLLPWGWGCLPKPAPDLRARHRTCWSLPGRSSRARAGEEEPEARLGYLGRRGPHQTAQPPPAPRFAHLLVRAEWPPNSMPTQVLGGVGLRGPLTGGSGVIPVLQMRKRSTRWVMGAWTRSPVLTSPSERHRARGTP